MRQERDPKWRSTLHSTMLLSWDCVLCSFLRPFKLVPMFRSVNLLLLSNSLLIIIDRGENFVKFGCGR